MPRACVIVLRMPVVPASFPDAAEYGDQGSDTLGNVARTAARPRLPNLEALVSATSSRSKAALRRRARRRMAVPADGTFGKGKDTTPVTGS